jgi:RimJ/RimL family protein N-acetyltransferase
MERADFEAMYRIAANPDLWAQHPVPELCRRDVFQANIDDAFEDKGGLTAIEVSTGEIAGYSRYSQRYSGLNAVEIGWTFLSPHLWGGVHNGEMKRNMLRHAFSSFPRVLFRVGEDNWRSRRALEKIGATLNGWRQDVESFGRVGTRVGYEISRETFEGVP